MRRRGKKSKGGDQKLHNYTHPCSKLQNISQAKLTRYAISVPNSTPRRKSCIRFSSRNFTVRFTSKRLPRSSNISPKTDPYCIRLPSTGLVESRLYFLLCQSHRPWKTSCKEWEQEEEAPPERRPRRSWKVGCCRFSVWVVKLTLWLLLLSWLLYMS